MNKQFVKVNDTYWFYPCSENEIKDLLIDANKKPTKQNINKVVNGIVEFIQGYEYDNRPIDSESIQLILNELEDQLK